MLISKCSLRNVRSNNEALDLSKGENVNLAVWPSGDVAMSEGLLDHVSSHFKGHGSRHMIKKQ
ncbi:hypothetical protein PanWU01x14_237540, partial [Parasponia andersonii]